MRAGLEGAASRAGVGGGPRPATLPQAPRGVDWSRSVSWRGSPTGSGRESLRQVVRAPPPSPCAQSRAGARAPAPPGLNSLPGGRSRTRRRGGVPPLPTRTPTGAASGDGAAGGGPREPASPPTPSDGRPCPGAWRVQTVQGEGEGAAGCGRWVDPAHRPGARPQISEPVRGGGQARGDFETPSSTERPTALFLKSLTTPLPGDSDSKESAYNVGDLGSIPGLGRSPGEGKGYPLQYSGLENSVDHIVQGVGHN